MLGEFGPILARTRTVHRPFGPIACDHITLIFVRAGSAVLFSEFGERRVVVGDVVLLGQNTLCGSEPDDWLTATTVHLDRDYLVDQVFWQNAATLHDRDEAHEFLNTGFSEPAQILPLGEDRAGYLLPWLDELVALTIDGPDPERFYRMQSLLFAVLDVVTPFISIGVARQSPAGRQSVRPVASRHRRLAPMRPEARLAAELLRSSSSERWTLLGLADEVHLSPAQLSRVFVDAYGKTPLAYLTMLRVEAFARLLRTTHYPIGVAAREVGWADASYAARVFRQCLGMTPRAYRAMSHEHARPLPE